MDNLIKKINNLREKIIEVKDFLNIERKKVQLRELDFLASKDGFWEDNLGAVKILQEIDNLKSEINSFESLESDVFELESLAALADQLGDDSVIEDFNNKFLDLEKKFSDLEFLLLFNEENDNSNAIISIHAGSGGVDAQDFAQILERMYLRFCEKNNFKVEILDRISASEAGIKTSVIKVNGPYAYAYLKSENGVHRLVRISPFDAESMRHTSFVGVEVVPEIKNYDDLDLNEKDLRIDVYKSSGPGGQSVNTTDSAVRIVHIPSGITVSCQSERSQHQNKERAMLILKAKLAQLLKDENSESLKKIKANAGQGTWGKQIRSYVFQPYQMVKDHRNNFSTSNLDDVLDGNIKDFIENYLRFLLKNKNK